LQGNSASPAEAGRSPISPRLSWSEARSATIRRSTGSHRERWHGHDRQQHLVSNMVTGNGGGIWSPTGTLTSTTVPSRKHRGRTGGGAVYVSGGTRSYTTASWRTARVRATAMTPCWASLQPQPGGELGLRPHQQRREREHPGFQSTVGAAHGKPGVMPLGPKFAGIDAGDNGTCLGTDARGIPRPRTARRRHGHL